MRYSLAERLAAALKECWTGVVEELEAWRRDVVPTLPY